MRKRDPEMKCCVKGNRKTRSRDARRGGLAKDKAATKLWNAGNMKSWSQVKSMDPERGASEILDLRSSIVQIDSDTSCKIEIEISRTRHVDISEPHRYELSLRGGGYR